LSQIGHGPMPSGHRRKSTTESDHERRAARGMRSLTGRQSDSVFSGWLFSPPFRMRLATGHLGPEYGPTDWSGAWRRWRESRAGGGLWDMEAACASRPPKPREPELMPHEEFLRRYGHRLTPAELVVGTLYWRDRLKPHVIRQRLGMKAPDMRAVLHSVIRRY